MEAKLRLFILIQLITIELKKIPGFGATGDQIRHLKSIRVEKMKKLQ